MWRFAPDVDPTTPEVYTGMQRLMATPWGTYRTSPSRNTALGTAGTQTVNGSQIFLKTDGTARWITGTSGKLWDSDGTGASFTDRSGTAYSASLTNQWQFCQYGDVTIAVQLGDNPQASSSGSFADLSGSPPKAALCCVQSNAVILANYNDGTAYTDGWWASDIGAHTTWTPAISNQAVNGRLLQTPGPIKCLIAFGGRVLAFKETSVYEGQYVGRPPIWLWRLLHPSIGVSGPNAATTDGKLVFFYGLQGAYIYDGAQFSRIDAGVEKYLQSNFAPAATIDVTYSYKEQIFCIHTTALFANFCPSSGLWGVGTDVEPSATGTNDGRPVRVPPGYTRRFVATVSGSCTHYEMTGTDYSATASHVVTGWIGTDQKMTQVTRVIPLFVPNGDYSYNNGQATVNPARLTYKQAYTRGATMGNSATANIDATRGRFDINVSGRWHEFKIEDMAGAASGMTGGMELAGLEIVAKVAGTD